MVNKSESNRRWREKNPDYGNKYYQENKDKFREYGRKRYERVPEDYNKRCKEYRLKYPEKYKEITRRWREENPHKTKAHNSLHTALENGSIKKEFCSICGNEDVEAHHEDYSKPLEVVWLCKKHHYIKRRISGFLEY